MVIQQTITILKVNDPYTNDKGKTYYSAQIIASGEVFRASIEKPLYEQLKDVVSEVADATLKLTAFNGRPSLTLVSVEDNS